MVSRIGIVITALFILSNVSAQIPTEVKAQALFMEAQEFYGNGDYAEAIKQLGTVKELLGSTNPRVEYLLCRSYLANGEAQNAESSMHVYFEMADESDTNYQSMLMLIREIEKKAVDQSERSDKGVLLQYNFPVGLTFTIKDTRFSGLGLSVQREFEVIESTNRDQRIRVTETRLVDDWSIGTGWKEQSKSAFHDLVRKGEFEFTLSHTGIISDLTSKSEAEMEAGLEKIKIPKSSKTLNNLNPYRSNALYIRSQEMRSYFPFIPEQVLIVSDKWKKTQTVKTFANIGILLGESDETWAYELIQKDEQTVKISVGWESVFNSPNATKKEHCCDEITLDPETGLFKEFKSPKHSLEIARDDK